MGLMARSRVVCIGLCSWLDDEWLTNLTGRDARADLGNKERPAV
jgi:hypothetical protein